MADCMDARLKSHFLNPLFLDGWVLYFLIQFDKVSTHFVPSWIAGFVPDLLCLPLVLWISLGALRKVFANQTVQLTVAMIAVAFCMFSILFELVLPRFRSIYTADIWDVMAYALGGVAFYFWQKEKP
jgi:hypothetical protein